MLKRTKNTSHSVKKKAYTKYIAARQQLELVIYSRCSWPVGSFLWTSFQISFGCLEKFSIGFFIWLAASRNEVSPQKRHFLVFRVSSPTLSDYLSVACTVSLVPYSSLHKHQKYDYNNLFRAPTMQNTSVVWYVATCTSFCLSSYTPLYCLSEENFLRLSNTTWEACASETNLLGQGV